MSGSSRWCSITIRVIGVEASRRCFWCDGKWARTATSLCHWDSGVDSLVRFLFLLRLRVFGGWGPLFRPSRNWDGRSSSDSRRFSARRNARSRIHDWFRHGNWIANFHPWSGGRAVVPVMWRMWSSGTQVGFRIYHQVGRKTSMWHHCWWNRGRR